MAIARAGGVTVDWLATGEGPRKLSDTSVAELAGYETRVPGSAARGAGLSDAAAPRAAIDEGLLRASIDDVETVVRELAMEATSGEKAEAICKWYLLRFQELEEGRASSLADLMTLLRKAS